MSEIERNLSILIDFYAQAGVPRARFAPPATAQDFAVYRDAFGEEVPAGLAEIYAVIGSGPLLNDDLLSIEQVVATRRMWDGIIAESDDPDSDYHESITSLDPDAVSALYWKSGWVQFAMDGGGNGFAVDLVPEPGGTVGQVINVGSDEDYRAVLAVSVADFLARIVRLTGSGRVSLSDDGYTRIDDDDTVLTALCESRDSR
ncbi:MAG TPA: SMI1/KNR4 family protein [Candidatus Limnocylindrales bacterium]|nr:SMI1/KNR4 family protein [Candidatus Limnocylindrales bacterium]